MATRLITAATVEPLTLDEAKTHLRVDITDDDALIIAYIKAAREHVETTELSGALITQTWELVLDAFPGNVFPLPLPPLQSVTSITYTDEDDVDVVYSAANYRVDAASFPGRVVLKSGSSWPSVTLKEVGGVVIRFVAGYGLAVSVPEPIKQATKLIIGDLYENRENTLVAQGVTIQTIPMSARYLLNSYRYKRF